MRMMMKWKMKNNLEKLKELPLQPLLMKIGLPKKWTLKKMLKNIQLKNKKKKLNNKYNNKILMLISKKYIYFKDS